MADQARRASAQQRTRLWRFLNSVIDPSSSGQDIRLISGEPEFESLRVYQFSGGGLKTIGLSMIVRNEASIIRNCLDSVRFLIDYVLIEDTGSTDGTPEIIMDWLRENNVPGRVIHEPWVDFSYNRSHALAAMRECPVDYALVMDADDEMEAADEFDVEKFKSSLSADVYYVSIFHVTIRYALPAIISNKIDVGYKGVLHEYLDRLPSHTTAQAEGLLKRHNANKSFRSRNQKKYMDDAATLEGALVYESDALLRRRYTFYLAQSYRDAGENEKAIERYLERAAMGGWVEEIYISLCNVGKLMEKGAYAKDAILDIYSRASRIFPSRAESLYYAARLNMETGRHGDAVRLAEKGLSVPLPASGLFVELWVYQYGLLDVMSVSAFWEGDMKASLECTLKALAATGVADDTRVRIARNAQMAYNSMILSRSPNSGSLVS